MLLLLLLPFSAAFAAEDLIETGSIKVSPRLQLDFFQHKLTDKWTLTKTGIDNFYAYADTSTARTPTETLTGQTFYLDLSLRPIDALTGTFGFEYVNNYADAYWRPHNREHQYTLNDHKFAWNTADINYTADWANLRYARGVGRLDWSNEGDVFGIFSETLIPQMFEVIAKGPGGRVQMVYGMDNSWENNDSHPHIGIYGSVPYLNYNFKLNGGSYHLLYKDEKSMFDSTGERVSTYELSGAYEMGDNPLQVGLLYRPFRLGWNYSYLADAPAGAGDVGSSFVKHSGTTNSGDAFGGGVKFTYKQFSFLDQMSLKYTYQGLVAGNKQQMGTELVRKLSRPLTATFDYTYRKPLQGPIPLIYEGTPANTGPALFEPRGPDSPFWVQWDNREASIISFLCTFDPTPSTWFYRYQPNVPEEWNLNPDENARISFATRYTLTRYFTGTDRLVYWNAFAEPAWEGYGATGAWATNDYIGAFNLLSVLNFPESTLRFIFDLELGQSLATASASYTLSTLGAKPITDYVITGLTMVSNPYEVSFKYFKDYWGPEYWHQTFGEAVDNVYKAKVSRKFGRNVTAGIDYTGVRERDKKYVAPELGDYDEYHCFVSISFGPIVGRFGSQWEAAADEPAADITPPFVALTVTPRIFTTGGDGPDSSCRIEPRASDLNGVAQWEITITGANGRVVKVFEGKGQPPDTVVWDGNDDVYAMPVHSGIYAVVLSAKDSVGNTALTQPIDVEVKTMPKVIIKEVPKEVKVTEISRGLIVSLASNVLFDVGKYQLKPAASKAMQEVVKILSAYPENNIVIEGHTDSSGDAVMNKKLSEARARSVANYLIAAGVAKERITTAGFGKTKPAASNATVKGRAANRRVEVIILKK